VAPIDVHVSGVQASQLLFDPQTCPGAHAPQPIGLPHVSSYVPQEAPRVLQLVGEQTVGGFTVGGFGAQSLPGGLPGWQLGSTWVPVGHAPPVERRGTQQEVPQFTATPQASVAAPHSPSDVQASTKSAHAFGRPPAPQACPFGHPPQSIVLPQPSEIDPHCPGAHVTRAHVPH
jgi:hypothetical protein